MRLYKLEFVKTRLTNNFLMKSGTIYIKKKIHVKRV